MIQEDRYTVNCVIVVTGLKHFVVLIVHVVLPVTSTVLFAFLCLNQFLHFFCCTGTVSNIGHGMYNIHMQHSWKWYTYNRCQNINKADSKEETEDGATACKSIKLTSKNKHAYPCIPQNADDDASFGQHLDMLTSELTSE